MLRKLFIFISLITLSSVAICAQNIQTDSDKKVSKFLRLAFSGSGSYMGVEIKEINKSNFAEMGLSKVQGVGVSKVLKNSPAEKAGLMAGDVIVSFNGDVITSRRKLTRMISEVAPDHTANLTVLRNGTEVEIPITIGKRPTPQLFEGNFDFPQLNLPNGEFPQIEKIIPRGELSDLEMIMPRENGQNRLIWRMSSGRSIGVGVTPLTKQLADYFGIKDGKGLLVNRVSKNSPAEKAGLKAGDIIIEIDGKKTSGTNDLIRGIYEKKEGSLNLTIVRDKNQQTISVTPEKRKSSPIRIGEDSN